MWNKPTPKQLNALPELYATENAPLEDKLIHMHFFVGGCDWYAAEYGPSDRLFFGYAILNNDLINSEWGYFSLDELAGIRTRQGIEIDRDLHWTVRKASEVDKIRQGCGWQV